MVIDAVNGLLSRNGAAAPDGGRQGKSNTIRNRRRRARQKLKK